MRLISLKNAHMISNKQKYERRTNKSEVICIEFSEELAYASQISRICWQLLLLSIIILIDCMWCKLLAPLYLQISLYSI